MTVLSQGDRGRPLTSLCLFQDTTLPIMTTVGLEACLLALAALEVDELEYAPSQRLR